MKIDSIRMPFPEDTFHKRQFPYFGEAFHELHNLPGEYIRLIPTEMAKPGGGLLKGDIAYLVMMSDLSIQIINVEDETSKVKKEELVKALGYKVLFIYNYWFPVLTVITTTVELNKCLKELKYSESDYFKPLIRSLPYDSAWDDLNNMVNKIKNQELFTKVDCLKFITLPRCCKHDQDLSVEKICEVLPQINVEEEFTKLEAIYCMQCLIHKYAKTDEDILRLQEMIGLKEVKFRRMNILDEMKAKGKVEGMAEGKAEGKVEGKAEGCLEVLNALVNDPNVDYSVEELSEKFGFTVDQILNGK